MSSINALLQPFAGYVDLKMYAEAHEELENLPAEFKNDSMVLLARLELLIEMRRWEEGAILGKSLCGQCPDELEFWFRTAYCLHELRRTQEAKDTLLNAPIAIRETATFHYNLACYEAQLGNLEAAKLLLKTCFKMEKGFRRDAVDDPDLKPLRDWLGGV